MLNARRHCHGNGGGLMGARRFQLTRIAQPRYGRAGLNMDIRTQAEQGGVTGGYVGAGIAKIVILVP